LAEKKKFLSGLRGRKKFNLRNTKVFSESNPDPDGEIDKKDCFSSANK